MPKFHLRAHPIAHPWAPARMTPPYRYTALQNYSYEAEDAATTSSSEDDIDREHGQAFEALGVQHFHGHQESKVELSNLCICLLLRLFFPFSRFAVMILLKMDWIRPILRTEQESFGTQTNQIFVLYGAVKGLYYLPYLTLNVVFYYITSKVYGNTGPPFATLFPWLIQLCFIGGYVAEAASASDNPSRAKYAQVVQFMRIIGRQCGLSESLLHRLYSDGTEENCLLALDRVWSDDLKVRREWLCGCQSSVELDDVNWKSQIMSMIIRTHRTCFTQVVYRDVVYKTKSDHFEKVGDFSWMQRWPATDRFVIQQERVHSLSSIGLYAPQVHGMCITNGLLESYKKNLLEGALTAADFTSQMSVGFPRQTPFWVRVMLVVAEVTFWVLLWSACIVAWWLPQWYHDGAWYEGPISVVLIKLLIFFNFVSFGMLDGVGSFLGRLYESAVELLIRYTELKVLNATLAGPTTAMKMCVPVMRLHCHLDLLVWAEVRELCLARYSARQLKMEVELLMATVFAIVMAICCVYTALQKAWDPGLFNFVGVLSLVLYIIFAVPFFVIGALVNVESKRSLHLMSQHALHAQLLVSHPTVASAEQRREIKETLSVAKLLVRHLQYDYSADVHILGVTLTPSTASALASTISTALGVTLSSLPVEHISEHIKKKLFASEAWNTWF